MRCSRAKINWITRSSFAIAIECEDREIAVELPIELLSPDMVEGQWITIQIDNGDRQFDT